MHELANSTVVGKFTFSHSWKQKLIVTLKKVEVAYEI